jgi:hypothetical protein
VVTDAAHYGDSGDDNRQRDEQGDAAAPSAARRFRSAAGRRGTAPGSPVIVQPGQKIVVVLVVFHPGVWFVHVPVPVPAVTILVWLGRRAGLPTSALTRMRLIPRIPTVTIFVSSGGVFRLRVFRLGVLRLGVLRLGVLRLGVLRLGVLRRRVGLPGSIGVTAPAGAGSGLPNRRIVRSESSGGRGRTGRLLPPGQVGWRQRRERPRGVAGPWGRGRLLRPDPPRGVATVAVAASAVATCRVTIGLVPTCLVTAGLVAVYLVITGPVTVRLVAAGAVSAGLVAARAVSAGAQIVGVVAGRLRR